MTTIILASHNQHKVDEIRKMLDPHAYRIQSLADIDFHDDIIEDGETMEENALIKARTIREIYNCSVIGEDSGLEVMALDNAPGVHTARYAGDDRDSISNMQKVLNQLERLKNRKARFKTVIAFIHEDQEYLLEGIVNGNIAFSMKGKKGFGYDPIFIPDGYDQTFAELGDTIKNSMSHRFNAVEKLKELLSQLSSEK
jgi:XTP/dITP diphosphohydrolase